MTNFNERTNTFFIKILSLTLYSRKGWYRLCVGGELETGTDCYILAQSSSDHSSTSFAFWLGCSTVGHWEPKALRLPLALTLASCPQLTQAVCVLVVFLFDVHLLPRIYTGASLDWQLCRGSICNTYVYPIYELKKKIKIWFSVHVAHLSVYFTGFVFLSVQKFDNRPLFKPGALCLIFHPFE